MQQQQQLHFGLQKLQASKNACRDEDSETYAGSKGRVWLNRARGGESGQQRRNDRVQLGQQRACGSVKVASQIVHGQTICTADEECEQSPRKGLGL